MGESGAMKQGAPGHDSHECASNVIMNMRSQAPN